MRGIAVPVRQQHHNVEIGSGSPGSGGHAAGQQRPTCQREQLGDQVPRVHDRIVHDYQSLADHQMRQPISRLIARRVQPFALGALITGDATSR